uniref:RNA demethylase ALKBH10B-like isoform X2 n=1 Tax=Erigeron canadensis TaxID=72917 RepID=UPI001CB93964|nr:RNA demethylase ALKBH10B-like isoform X2 [Erigeron canadensis]
MAPPCGVSASPSNERVLQPTMMPVQPPAAGSMMMQKDAIISWFRGEFAAANAIIDALCGHLAQLEGGKCEYESVFAAIHRRRLNWIPILQMQKYFSIADVTLELQKVADQHKIKMMTKDQVVEEIILDSSPAPLEEIEDKDNKSDDERLAVECHDETNGHVDAEVADVDITTTHDSPKNVITDSESHEIQSLAENNEICFKQEEEWEARRAQIKMTKGFVAKESVKGHMVNVVRGLKLYDDIFNDTELSTLSDFVTELRVAGQNGELSGETFIKYNQQSKAIKRELIQFGAPIFGQIKDEATAKSQDSHIEPIPAPLEDVIDHLIQYHLISENRRPNSCIISFFDEGEFSQPFLKPPHLEQPISTLFLSESTMAFGRTLVCDNDGNYKGPLMLSLNKGSVLVMRGNSSDMARHVMCQSPTKRISVTFFKVRIETSENISSPTAPTTQAMTVWQPNHVPNVKGLDTASVVPKWGVLRAPQLLMLAPVQPMVMSPRRLPRGGTGVFLPWTAGSRKSVKHLPPRAQRGRLLVSETHRVEPAPDLGISVA